MNNSVSGFASGFLAYFIWGLFPLFFNLLIVVSPFEVLVQRIIWSFIFVLIILLVLKRLSRMKIIFKDKALMFGLIGSSILISINWLVFIWAVSQGRVLESSFGYFLTPLVSVFLARVFLKEQLDYWRIAAIILALIGIIWSLVGIGYISWVSMTLATSFGLYGLVRKQLKVDTLTGLSLETLVLLPFALAYWVWLEFHTQSAMFHMELDITLLLIASGVVTALPLLLFASAAKKMSLTAIGFLMYINPSLQFITAISFLNEPLNNDLLVSFYFIWCALLVFSIGSVKSQNSKLMNLLKKRNH